MKRKPVFSLTPKQVWDRCRKLRKPQLCAGQVLALMSLMLTKNWTALELSGHSHVGRSTISEILSLKLSPTSIIWNALAETCGFTLFEFVLLAAIEVRIQVSG